MVVRTCIVFLLGLSFLQTSYSQKLSACNYSFTSYNCNIEFPCNASIDTSNNRLIISKTLQNNSGKVIGAMTWTVQRAQPSEKAIFNAMLKAEEKYRKEYGLTYGTGSEKQKPESTWIACPDSIYCAEYKLDYYDGRMANYDVYNYVSYSTNGVAIFRIVLKAFEGYSLSEIKAFRDKLMWQPVHQSISAPINKFTFRLPAGIFTAVELENGVYIFKINVRDEDFLKKTTFTEMDILSLNEYIRIKKHSFNTEAAVKTIEKQIQDEQKKKGWECYNPKKITLPGSDTEVTKIVTYRSYTNTYNHPDNDSSVFYILSFQNAKENKKIPPHIRTIYVAYVPLREGTWYRSIEAITRERILASIRPIY